jgi:hypothetical protein
MEFTCATRKLQDNLLIAPGKLPSENLPFHGRLDINNYTQVYLIKFFELYCIIKTPGTARRENGQTNPTML